MFFGILTSMMKNLRPELIRAIENYLDGKATDEEKKLVNQWYRSFDLSKLEIDTKEPDLEGQINARMHIHLEQIATHGQDFNYINTNRRVALYKKVGAIAAILLMVGAGVLFFVPRNQTNQIVKENSSLENDVAPGRNHAILTLSDGSKISLDDVKEGKLANQRGISIVKTAEGNLVYRMDPGSSADSKPGRLETQYNTIEAPRGGQFQLVLVDGSKVWLNAASTLRFPAMFSKGERKVILTGEAYFEVAPNKHLPFRVENDGQVVEVLGTHFNINSYANQSVIKTTLLEGAVKVTQKSTGKSVLLNPKEEARLSTHGESMTVGAADIQEAVSWKNGEFRFNDITLKEIMMQIERWYDVEIDYSQIPNTRYNVSVPRNVNLSQVLRILEVTGDIKFEIDGKKIRIKK